MKLPPLSQRLTACAQFVRTGDRVADIGCDHGYLGISLLLQNIASSVIAADINRLPLKNAAGNADAFGVSDRMSFFLSDGVEAIPRDFTVLICAGMGADTIMGILDRAPWLKSPQYRLILQCQSRRPALREYLFSNGYTIRNETLAQDGKFIYTIMEVVPGVAPPLSGADFFISPALRVCGSPLLPDFYKRVVSGVRKTVSGLSRSGGEKYAYYRAVLDELLTMEETI